MTIPWHTLGPDEVLERLRSGPEGLDPAEAEGRLERHGPNRLERAEPVSPLRILANQFASLVVLLLIAAALVALALGDAIEALAIGAVLAINTLIGFVVELRARRAMDALLRRETPAATVVRAGRTSEMPAERLVPGDVIVLEEGGAVPADARLLSAKELRVDEAPLTGESIPVDKDPRLLADAETPLADRTPMLYSGTTLTAGRGRAVVVHTGSETEIGKVGTLISTVEQAKTPLEVRLDALGHRLVWLTLAVAAVVIGLGVLRGTDLGLMIETGIALAIAAVPEGLPAVATIALAVGLRRMARRHALVRRLAAVEALGATTVVCTDKTGTLTAGEMVVTRVATAGRDLTVSGVGFSTHGAFHEGEQEIDRTGDPWLTRLLAACALTARASIPNASARPVGDPTDAALLVLALKAGLDPDALRAKLPEEDEVPFTSERQSSATIHRGSEGPAVFVKGAPGRVLERCTSWANGAHDDTLTDDVRETIRARNRDLANQGLRVIALASGRTRHDADLTLLGLAGIVDPPAEGVAEAIQTLLRAGIRTVMVTGDQRATGEAIARQLRMVREDDAALDGRELASIPPQELPERLAHVGVLSRVSPEDKVRIVGALQERGEIVAMIGDGVNDAAALKKADIGVAMGKRGTDVAKQTASMVLTDDRFPTIGAAVEEGRVIYDNIRKFVFYLFSCNLAEVLVLLGASVQGTTLPLLPLQILWLNLVTDTFPALALALEPAEPGVMDRRPRAPDAPILSRGFLGAMLMYASLITAVTLGAYFWASATRGPERAVTVAFMTLALAQLFHLGNARSRGPVLSLDRVFANPWAVVAVPLVIGLQLLTLYLAPLARVLGTVPLTVAEWGVVVGLSLVPAVLGQVIAIARRREREA